VTAFEFIWVDSVPNELDIEKRGGQRGELCAIERGADSITVLFPERGAIATKTLALWCLFTAHWLGLLREPICTRGERNHPGIQVQRLHSLVSWIHPKVKPLTNRVLPSRRISDASSGVSGTQSKDCI